MIRSLRKTNNYLNNKLEQVHIYFIYSDIP